MQLEQHHNSINKTLSSGITTRPCVTVAGLMYPTGTPAKRARRNDAAPATKNCATARTTSSTRQQDMISGWKKSAGQSYQPMLVRTSLDREGRQRDQILSIILKYTNISLDMI